jgi:hypothetical protein
MIIRIWPLNPKDVDEKTTPSKVLKNAKIIIIYVLINFLTFSFWVLDQFPFMASFSSFVHSLLSSLASSFPSSKIFPFISFMLYVSFISSPSWNSTNLFMLSFFCEQKLFCTFQTNIILHYVN